MADRKIEVTNIEWSVQRLYEDRQLVSERKSGAIACDALCECGHKWRSHNSDWIRVIGGGTMKCPECGAEDSIPKP